MSDMTIVTACMGRLAYLRQSLGRMVAQPGCSCVVVDYSCPDGSGDWVAAHHPAVRVVRVPGQTRFSVPRARNAGLRAIETPWVCFCDADVVPESSFIDAVRPLLRPGSYYRPAPLDDTGLYGTFIALRADLERVGGYDEVYQGWGDEDVDLYRALEFVGLSPRASRLPSSATSPTTTPCACCSTTSRTTRSATASTAVTG